MSYSVAIYGLASLAHHKGEPRLLLLLEAQSNFVEESLPFRVAVQFGSDFLQLQRGGEDDGIHTNDVSGSCLTVDIVGRHTNGFLHSRTYVTNGVEGGDDGGRDGLEDRCHGVCIPCMDEVGHRIGATISEAMEHKECPYQDKTPGGT